MNTKRAKWTPSHSSAIYSNHFSKDCLEHGSETVETYKVSKLKRDEYGVCVFPNIHGYTVEKDSDRAKRMKQKEVITTMSNFLL